MRMGRPRRAASSTLADPAVKSLFEAMDLHGVKTCHVEQVAGLGARTIHKWRDGQEPKISTLRAALNSIGYEIVVMTKEDK